MADASHCPRCLTLCLPGEECPSCSLGVPQLAPRFVPLSREVATPHSAQVTAKSIEPPANQPAPLALLAILFGLLAFGMAWLPSLRPLAAILAGLGLLVGVSLLPTALNRGLQACGLSLAGTLVSLQGLILAVAMLHNWVGVVEEPTRQESPPSAVATIPGPGSGSSPAKPELSPNVAPTDRQANATALRELLEAYELWKQAPKKELILTFCMPQLLHANAEVRQTAEEWLRTVGRAIVPELVALLRQPERETRRTASRALATLGAEAKNELKALLIAMGDPDAFVRLQAARAVYSITFQKHLVIPVLRRCLEDESEAIRREAADLLRTIEEG